MVSRAPFSKNLQKRLAAGLLLGCGVSLGALTGCTTFDDLVADPNAIGASSGGPGGTCATPPCGDAGAPAHAACKLGNECASGICEGGTGTCTEASSLDGVKNGNESDIDCGGSAPTNAAKCLEGKACRDAADCHWGYCTNSVCEGHKPGRKDGDQTDIDCGGTLSPKCDWEKSCLFDRDCTSGNCGADKKCLVGPSCATVHGGTTCGTGEFADPAKKHESCCKSLPVTGFTDTKYPGKKVYLDKYEITAGRMRAFVDAMAKANGGEPNIKAYMAAHRPAVRWNQGWEDILPQGYTEGDVNYTVTNPTTSMLYPGQDQVVANAPFPKGFSSTPGTFMIIPSVNYALGAVHFFPEFVADATWAQGPDYAASHNLNCTNEAGAYGYSTYWFPKETIADFGGGDLGKFFKKEDMDEKALNCAPFGLFAAFCAWDGGQLMTDEVFDHIAGGAWPERPAGDATTAEPIPPPPPRLAGANSLCGGATPTINTFPDGTQDCFAVYQYPDDQGNTHDGSSRIASPGRVPADSVSINAGEEPWMDLKGNLEEAILRSDGRFGYRGYGVGWASITAHRAQVTTPRMKAGSFGARCMRYRD